MTSNKIIDKSFKNLASFSEEILVICPHCNEKAFVRTVLGQYTVPYPTSPTKSKFICNNCYKPINENTWYGPIIISPLNSKCGNCGSTTIQEKRLVKKYQNKMKVSCNDCGETRYYETRYSFTYANNNQATDPYFGLQLWLQIPFENNILWAYNTEHLIYLKNYVGAKLREATSGGKYSLAWKLPNFIKIAKNREKILKAITRLEKKD